MFGGQLRSNTTTLRHLTNAPAAANVDAAIQGGNSSTQQSASLGATPTRTRLGQVIYYDFGGASSAVGAAMPKVEIATVGKVASVTVFMFCLLTLILFWISDFYILYPPLSVLFMAIATVLYAVSFVVAKQGPKA